ncbi:MAG: PQQ-binding-like beta-propeller repeat protein, partial [Ktedonobacterales bacterium]
AALSLTTGGFLWEVTAPGVLAAISDQMLLLSDLQTVTAADARTGHIMWQAPLNFEGKPSGYPTSVAWATPDVTAVIGSYQGEVLALNSANGTALWHVTFSGYTPDRLVTEHGIVIVTLLPPPESSTPARLAALSAKTGAVYWERDVPDTFMFLAQVSATNAS